MFLSLRISPKCWCVPIIVMSRNELAGGIALDTGWFRMLWQHSNTLYEKNIGCVCGELWSMWYWYVIGKNGTLGEGLDVRKVWIFEARAVNIS